MEKLQKALLQAREDRERSDQEATASERGEGSGIPALTEPDRLWADLRQVDVQTPHLIRNRVLGQDYGDGSAPFDILLTKTLLQMRRNNWRRLAITSATPQCGKSTIACNLALALSRQSDLRTILWEMDLRDPSIGRMLSVTPPDDVSRVITGEVNFADQAVRLRDNVALSIASGPSRDPARYLFSHRAEEVLDAVEAAYEPDVMIFDMPAILASDDTRAFLSKADCAMIVARAESTTLAQIDACEREIAESTNVLGVVLNQMRFADGNGG